MSEQRLRVLLIEDNPGDANLIGRILRGSRDGVSIHVETTTRLSDGLERLRQHPADAVLLDLHLPDSSGTQTLQILHQQFPDVPVVVLTTEGQASTILDCVKGGARDYFVKERLNAKALTDCICRVVETYRALKAKQAE